MAEGLSPKDLVLQLMNLRQSSSVQAYIDRFDETLTHVNLHVDLPEAFSMSCFRGGLRRDISDRVRQLFPTSLQQAFSDAKFVETVINLEQIASQPPLHFHTHEAESTLDTNLEQNKGDETLELAIDIKEATVAAVDIADDDAFTMEAKPEQLDRAEGVEAESGEIEVAATVYEATPEHPVGIESNETDPDNDEIESAVTEEDITVVEFEKHAKDVVLANDRENIRHPTNQLGIVSLYYFDPFLISISRRVQIMVPQFGFRRVYCPVAANLLHLFRKFGELHDAFRVFIVMPHDSDFVFSQEELAARSKENDASVLQQYGGVKGVSETLKIDLEKVASLALGIKTGSDKAWDAMILL